MARWIRTIPVIAVLAPVWALAEIPNHEALRALSNANLPVIAALRVDRPSGPQIEVESFLRDEPVNGQALVDLGSITKTITAVLVLHLVDAGLLSLDDRLGDLLSDVPADKAGITVHQLLTHTSGLPETSGSDEEELGRDAFLSRVFAAPLSSEPGATYLYSNPGYGVLAAMVEIATAKSYERYLIEDVLAPNDLPPIGYASVYDEDRSILSARVWPSSYLRRPIAQASWGGVEPGWNLVGNGGLVTTAEGFLEFWSAFVDGRIVSAPLVAKALTPHVDEGGGDTFYGYGLVVETLDDDTTVYWHDGGNEAFSAEWRHFAPDGRTVFVAGPGGTAFEAMDRIREGR